MSGLAVELPLGYDVVPESRSLPRSSPRCRRDLTFGPWYLRLSYWLIGWCLNPILLLLLQVVQLEVKFLDLASRLLNSFSSNGGDCWLSSPSKLGSKVIGL